MSTTTITRQPQRNDTLAILSERSGQPIIATILARQLGQIILSTGPVTVDARNVLPVAKHGRAVVWAHLDLLAAGFTVAIVGGFVAVHGSEVKPEPEPCPWDSATCAEHDHAPVPCLPYAERHSAHVSYPHTPGYLYDCTACEERCHCTPGNAECVWSGHEHEHLVEDDRRFAAMVANQARSAVPTVEIYRRSHFYAGDECDEPWRPVNDGETITEEWDGEWDREDYGSPVLWAAARIRDLSCDHNLEPSAYPLPVGVHERVWLSATYENPYVSERIETSAYVRGVSDTERAEIFRLAMLPGAEWVATLHAYRYGDRA